MHWKSFIAFTTLLAAGGAFCPSRRKDHRNGEGPNRRGGQRGLLYAATNSATGAKQETKSDDQGVYSFPALAVGQYNIEISASGFTPYRRTGVAINVSSALQVDVTLQLASQSTTVNVNEEAAQSSGGKVGHPVGPDDYNTTD